MEQVKGVDEVGPLALARHTHHQHEVHEPVGRVSGQVQAVQTHLGQAPFEVPVGDLDVQVSVEVDYAIG